MENKETFPVFSFPPDFVRRVKEMFPDRGTAAILENDGSKDRWQLADDRNALSGIFIRCFDEWKITPERALEIIKHEGVAGLERLAKQDEELLELYRELGRIKDSWEKTVREYNARQEEKRNEPLRKFNEWLATRNEKSSRS